MIRLLGGTVLDPKTRKATAFYAALGIAIHDVWTRGFNLFNFGMLASLAGLGAVIAGLQASGVIPKDGGGKE